MYAIVEIAGQQFKVAKDQKVYVHRLQDEEGSKVTFDNVLLLEDGSNITIGAPAIDGAAVEAKVVKHLKGDKVIVFKKKRRKGYKKKNGHRQYMTQLVIEAIIASGAKKAVKASVSKSLVEEAKPIATKKEDAPVAKTKAVAKETVADTITDLSKMTVAELKEMAKSKGIDGISSMKKPDLIAVLSK